MAPLPYVCVPVLNYAADDQTVAGLSLLINREHFSAILVLVTPGILSQVEVKIKCANKISAI